MSKGDEREGTRECEAADRAGLGQCPTKEQCSIGWGWDERKNTFERCPLSPPDQRI